MEFPFPRGRAVFRTVHSGPLYQLQGSPVSQTLDREETVRNGRRVPGALPRLLPAALSSVLQSEFVQKPSLPDSWSLAQRSQLKSAMHPVRCAFFTPGTSSQS